MVKDQIIKELALLGPEDLSDVRAWLERHAAAEPAKPAVARPLGTTVHIRSPRLADPAQAACLTKQVLELPADAGL